MLLGRREKPPFRETLRVAVWPRRSFGRSFRYVVKRMARLQAGPHAVGLGFALGATVGMTPFFGLHVVSACALAWAFGGSVVAAALGTFVNNPLTLPFILGGTYEAGRSVQRWFEAKGPPEAVVPMAQDRLLEGGLFTRGFDRIWPLIEPMAIGSIPVGIAVFAVSYGAVRFLMQRVHDARRHRLEARYARREASA